MPARKGRRNRRFKKRRGGRIGNILRVPDRVARVVRLPFTSYNTFATGFSSFYLHPINVGLDHLKFLNDAFIQYRFTRVAITLYPTSSQASAIAYSNEVLPSAVSSVGTMSQLTNFVLQTNGMVQGVTLILGPLSLRKDQSIKWFRTDSASSSIDHNQGVVYCYTSGTTAYYKVEGVIEYCDPSSTAHAALMDLDAAPDPEPTPIHPADPTISTRPREVHSEVSVPWRQQGTTVDERKAVPAKTISQPFTKLSIVSPRSYPSNGDD